LVISDRSGGTALLLAARAATVVGEGLGKKSVGRPGRVFGLTGVRVDARHLVLGGDRLHLVVVVAERLEVAEGDEAQRVAGLADFVVDLEAALQLLLVELAEGPSLARWISLG
jgi:hypothetical protein